MLRRIVTLILLFALAAAPLAAPQAAPAADPLPVFLVGFAERDITPTPETSEDGAGNVYLGGFGIGPTRLSQGVDYPLKARAVVVSDGVNVVALGQADVTGSFAAYRTGPFGWYDVMKSVEAATGGAIPRDHVIVSSAHSHRGPDTTGAWGGVPDAYLALVANATRDAVLDAFAHLEPAHAKVGRVDARDFLSSDFWWPGHNEVDAGLRVLAFESPVNGSLLGVFGQVSAHATVHGSAPRISPDWPGVVADRTEARVGAPVLLTVGAIGRTHQQSPEGVVGPDAWQDALAARFVEAVAGAGYVTRGGVDADVDLVRLPAWNGFLLAMLEAGDAACGTPAPPEACVPVLRSRDAPWVQGNVVGTLVSGARIGDVFLWGAPGEVYPNAHWDVERRVPAREHFVIGLANDHLGYLVAPTDAWPLVLAHTPVSDNAMFNVDATAGDHVACAAVDIARVIGFTADTADPGGFVLGERPFGVPAHCRAWALEDRALPS